MKFKKLFLLGLVMFCAFGVGRAFAVLPASCDSDFYDVMNARAQLHAMREVEMAQTLILKPDSVLEYSCFMDRLIELNAAADDMFSDNVDGSELFNDPPMTYTPSGPFLPQIDEDAVTAPNTGQTKVQVGPNPPGGDLHAARLGNVIGLMVTNSLQNFLYSNFGHLYAGGTYAGAAASTCKPMALVWDFLRCKNFDANLFMTFEEMTVIDNRIHPTACNVSNRSTLWQAALDASYTVPGGAGGVEPVVTHLDRFDSSACGTSTPVKIGVQVYEGSPLNAVREDAFCIPAGCYYNGLMCQ